MNIKRPKYTEFICPNRKCHEKIPTDIVLQMDMMDSGDPIYPPMFDCQKCGTQMKPVYFIGFTGIGYTYDGNQYFTYIPNLHLFVKVFCVIFHF